jgi:hypothetical protein
MMTKSNVLRYHFSYVRPAISSLHIYNLKNGLQVARIAQLISKLKLYHKLYLFLFVVFFLAVTKQKATALAGKPEVGKTGIFRAISVTLGNEHKKLKK